MKMKVLSVQQPWAWLLTSPLLTDHERKDVENRTWTTSYRGPLLIHASLSFDHSSLEWLSNHVMTGIYLDVLDHFDIIKYGRSGKTVCRNKKELGCIVGSVNLHSIVDNSRSPWANPGCLHWLVSRGPQTPFLYCSGRLGLWELDSRVLE